MARNLFRKETVWFFWIVVLLHVGFWAALSLQMLGREIWPVGGGEGWQAALAAYSGIGAGKEKLLQGAGLAICAVVGGLYLILLFRPGRLTRTLILAAVAPSFIASSVWVQSARYYHEQGLKTFPYRLNVSQLSNGELKPRFLRFAPGRRVNQSTFTDFARMLDQQFSEVESTLDANWRDNKGRAFPPNLLRALFYTNHVSALWASGMPEGINAKGGCVLSDAAEAGKDASGKFKTFWDAKIGCCTDYTLFLAALLTQAGIENRILTVTELAGIGHTFNEARIGGTWWALDANIGVAYEGAWQQLMALEKTVASSVYLLDHPGLDPANGDLFRYFLGSFRQSILNRAAERNPENFSYRATDELVQAWLAE
jgi:hypothetical protein